MYQPCGGSDFSTSKVYQGINVSDDNASTLGLPGTRKQKTLPM